MEKGSPKKVCLITTLDISLDQLHPGFFACLQAKLFEVVGICADGPFVNHLEHIGVRVITVPMTRQFTPIQDLKCLWLLYGIFKHEKFDLIHYSTPKASLLASIAARLTHCPTMLYMMRGLGYAAFSGTKRKIGKWCEKLVCFCAHDIIAISTSLKEEAILQGLVSKDRIKVLGAGSSKGVDLQQFCLNSQKCKSAKKIRACLGIQDNDIVIGYAGRLTAEKGISELLNAFTNIRKFYENIHLILVGDQDARNPLSPNILNVMATDAAIHIVPFNGRVAHYMAAMDIFVLASYREGFGNVLIEASAVERAVIGTDIVGARDALINGQTGCLVKAHDSESLEKALTFLIHNPAIRKEMGHNGREWVEKNFDRTLVWNNLMNEYDQLLHKKRSRSGLDVNADG